MEDVLEVKGLHTYFNTPRGVVKSVRGVDLRIGASEIVCLVGESGSGKSVTAHSIMRLLPRAGGIAEGEIRFSNLDIVKASEAAMRKIRGNDISMIFQEPMTSLNPVLRVGRQVSEVIRLHEKISVKAAKDRVVQLFRDVGIPAAEKRYDAYPHEMSGGMRQRVMIAMALACKPHLIIADEPTTALDVTIQAQVLDLLRSLVVGSGSSLLLITHDLGVVSETADRVAVMYAGQIVESADVTEFFEKPLHPYSVALMNCVPQVDADHSMVSELPTIPGTVPDLANLPSGCVFQDRCQNVFSRCRESDPPFTAHSSTRQVRCWLHV
ncbi:ABC transporter ATP-binding protein [Limoniibacter endophyticus]|uniref:Peptide ABC transporter ATP-binding protein n=1 Tax=Limoniibacter endophyticus TaxID=1565040 RepID=A0A8J3DSU3_9HYPH|nr:ABC transporter ATP-binding protein [Limoniibacter endophyticus]GHC78965.1 peptide ABC transporter ATP-binding protein [Limoniibacter endophyticus]